MGEAAQADGVDSSVETGVELGSGAMMVSGLCLTLVLKDYKFVVLRAWDRICVKLATYFSDKWLDIVPSMKPLV